MPTDGLIAIVPVLPEKVNSLREAVGRLGGMLLESLEAAAGSAAPPRHLAWTERLHFARLALFPPAPGRPEVPRLLLATDYDGEWDQHVAQLHLLGSVGERIWECCEGYAGEASFPEWIDAHTIEPGAYYIAFRDQDLEELQNAVALREEFEQQLSRPDAADRFRFFREQRNVVLLSKRCLAFTLGNLTRILQFLGSAPTVVRILRQFGFRLLLQAANHINQTLGRVGWIRVLNVLTRNSPRYDGPGSSQAGPPFSEASLNHPQRPGSPSAQVEDALFQNQLTLVTDVPPEDVARLKVVLALIDLYGRNLSTPGTLVGISTIHTVRWALIDGDRRLLMVSNYDGSWENYIDEFAEMILSGLNALWRSAPDYPRAGAQDVAALKEFLRGHQVQANLFYSAYPQSSVLNLKESMEFSRWLGWLLPSPLPTSPAAASSPHLELNA